MTYIMHFRTATLPFIRPFTDLVKIIMVKDPLKPNITAETAEPIDPIILSVRAILPMSIYRMIFLPYLSLNFPQ